MGCSHAVGSQIRRETCNWSCHLYWCFVVFALSVDYTMTSSCTLSNVRNKAISTYSMSFARPKVIS